MRLPCLGLRPGLVLRTGAVLIGMARGSRIDEGSGLISLALDDGRIIEIDFLDVNNRGSA